MSDRKKTFYIASSGDNLELVMILRDVMESTGMYEMTFPWPGHFEHKCSTDLCGIMDRMELGHREIEGVLAADIFIGIARMGKGTHVELGLALSRSNNKIILVDCDPKDCVFYGCMSVQHMTLKQLLIEIQKRSL